MSSKKEKLLQKYINKKKKQLKRDELIAKIAQIDKKKLKTKRMKSGDVNKSIKKKEVVEYDEPDNNDKNKYACNDKNQYDYNSDEININEPDSNELVEIDKMDKSESDKQYSSNGMYELVEIDKMDKSESDKDCSFNGIDCKLKHDEHSDKQDNDSEKIESETCSNHERDELEYTNKVIKPLVNDEKQKYESNINTNTTPIYSRIVVDRPQEIQNERQQLPIFYEQAEITSLILNNSIVSIKGPTGCGKTTQIPQFIYEAGLTQGGLIAITQPRRISTVSISSRINEELGSDVCGYQIRYDSNIKCHHHMVAMTDGILIKEIQDDFLISKYSVIILDEVHERSCNLDLLISLLSKIVKMRNNRDKDKNEDKDKDKNVDKNKGKNITDAQNGFSNPLKVILMSASETSDDLYTLFDSVKSFHVPSAPHKLSIFYEEKTPSDYIECAHNVIRRIMRKEGRYTRAILVFLPSKSDIYRLKGLIEEHSHGMLASVVLPLHSSLFKKDQSLVFKTYDKLKIILSTNIAETSITIPDVGYVLDSGLVKNKYVSLQGIVKYTTEYISKSSALQRAGRAGRTTKGTCYRLYSGDTYSTFPDQDTPRIRYEPLDSLVLDLISLGIPDIFKFPFITQPPTRHIEVALSNLRKLGIIDKDSKLTDVGQVVPRLPIPPRLSRLLCIQNTTHLLPRLILVVSCLSVDCELKKTKENEKFYISEKSDMIVMIKMLIEFIKDVKKNEHWGTKHRQNVQSNCIDMTEAAKMNNFLLRKFYKGDKLKEAYEKQLSPLENDEKNELRRIFYQVYSSNLAIPNTDCYFFKEMNVHLSTSSIQTDDEFVVFDFLSQGSKRIYMKNVTIIDKEWLI